MLLHRDQVGIVPGTIARPFDEGTAHKESTARRGLTPAIVAAW